jgi:hypothetical protein
MSSLREQAVIFYYSDPNYIQRDNKMKEKINIDQINTYLFVEESI